MFATNHCKKMAHRIVLVIATLGILTQPGFAGFVFLESFETPVVDTYQNSNGNWLNFGINTPGKTGSDASRGVSFVGDSGLTWTVDSGNVDIVDDSEWAAAQGRQSLELFGWENGSIYTNVSLSQSGNYNLKFFLAGYPNVAGTMDVKVNGSSILSGPLQTQTQAPTYSQVGIGFNVGAPGIYELRFESLSPIAGPVIDYVSLEYQAVPEPGSIFGLCLAGVGCSFIRRRR
jgi:hypothetical protein